MNKILIIGYGVVGTNLHKELDGLEVEVYDLYKSIDTRTQDSYKLAFVCVDTPYTEEDANDVSEVINAVNDNESDIFVIKSTILPGSTDVIKEKTGKRIVFSPEYFGGTQHNLNFDFNFTILGGEKEDCIEVQQILQGVYDGRHTFRITDAVTAETVKYMENSWLAAKVSFMQEFYELSEFLGIHYEELRELFILDPRVNPSHTFVYRKTPYWSSHCLDKDVPAIAENYDMKLLKSIIDFNESQKKRYK